MNIKDIVESLNYYFHNYICNSLNAAFIYKLTFNNTRIGAYKEAQLDIYFKKLKEKAVLVDTLKLTGKVINDDKGPLTEDVCKAFIVWLLNNKEKIESYGI